LPRQSSHLPQAVYPLTAPGLARALDDMAVAAGSVAVAVAGVTPLVTVWSWLCLKS